MREVGPIHHAPWSGRFKTMWFRGSFAYEAQVGPFVFQVFYAPFRGRRFHVWKDRFWR
jgi:hypothetical protein